MTDTQQQQQSAQQNVPPVPDIKTGELMSVLVTPPGEKTTEWRVTRVVTIIGLLLTLAIPVLLIFVPEGSKMEMVIGTLVPYIFMVLGGLGYQFGRVRLKSAIEYQNTVANGLNALVGNIPSILGNLSSAMTGRTGGMGGMASSTRAPTCGDLSAPAEPGPIFTLAITEEVRKAAVGGLLGLPEDKTANALMNVIMRLPSLPSGFAKDMANDASSVTSIESMATEALEAELKRRKVGGVAVFPSGTSDLIIETTEEERERVERKRQQKERIGSTQLSIENMGWVGQMLKESSVSDLAGVQELLKQELDRRLEVLEAAKKDLLNTVTALPNADTEIKQ